MVNRGELVYPSYTISKTTPVFKCRDDLIRLSKSLLLEDEFRTAMEDKKLEAAFAVYTEARKEFDIIVNNLSEETRSTVSLWNIGPQVFSDNTLY